MFPDDILHIVQTSLALLGVKEAPLYIQMQRVLLADTLKEMQQRYRKEFGVAHNDPRIRAEIGRLCIDALPRSKTVTIPLHFALAILLYKGTFGSKTGRKFPKREWIGAREQLVRREFRRVKNEWKAKLKGVEVGRARLAEDKAAEEIGPKYGFTPAQILALAKRKKKPPGGWPKKKRPGSK